jgi:hypothetical protein
MATRKKKINPIATALTIAGLGLTGWLLWKYVINPRRNKLKAASTQPNFVDSEILDANFEIVDDQQA